MSGAEITTLEQRARLEAILHGMQSISAAFYGEAVRQKNHTFIEFTGFLNEYIKICRNTMNGNVDFTMCSVHTGQGLIVQDYEIAYIAEKFECVFGEALNTPERQQVFMKAMGWVS